MVFIDIANTTVKTKTCNRNHGQSIIFSVEGSETQTDAKDTKMSRPKTTFRSYAAAVAFAKRLHLRTMRDWVAFSKNGNSETTRPKDIPSNPWVVYQSELAQMGKKFSINEFLGSKRSRISKSKTAISAAGTRSLVSKPANGNGYSKLLTYAQARAALRKMHVKSRADFNALVRMRLLPPMMPERPSTAFKSKWRNWSTFLSA